MTAIESQLLQHLRKLSPDRAAELVDFAAFLAARQERQAAAQRLGESMAKLHGLALPPLSDDEIGKAVQESRRERRLTAEKNAPSDEDGSLSGEHRRS